jgi:hypothetical protein
MKQTLLAMLCLCVGHDWREKDDSNERTCCICGALKSETGKAV